MALKNLGTATPLSMRCHCTGSTPMHDGACASVAVCSIPSPCASPMRPSPDEASIAAARSFAAPRAAIPISAHEAHCTLTPTVDCARRHDASASRHTLAAE
eukprot:5775584-Prymnesium_polylepis.3